MNYLPCIKEYNGVMTLFVDEQPYIILGGELHNSSTSNLNYMEQKVWPNLKGLNLNTVILPISWETIEPEEEKFDFTIVDGLIQQARREKMHLVVLWFGLWKNGESDYVPHWVKKDTKTYFRVKGLDGQFINTISPLCELAVEKDKNAFKHLVQHIKEIDEEENTVLMIQVENEIGIMGTVIDDSDIAREAFVSEIPSEVQEEFQISGTWKEALEKEYPGKEIYELFMCYYFAKAIENIASAGNDIYPIPYYVNAWLEQHPWKPGSYPCGGPVIKMKKMWKLMAPALSFLAPDIYVSYATEVMDQYTTKDNPLFIPEIRKDPVCATYALYAFAGCNALGYSPFAIEDFNADPATLERIPMEVFMALNIDGTAFDCTGSATYLSKVYEILHQTQDLYFKYRGTSHLQGFVKRNENDLGISLSFKNYDILITYNRKENGKPMPGGMIYELEDNKFLVIGMMCRVEFQSKLGESLKTEVLQYEEGSFVNSNWIPGRILNGDEKRNLGLKDMPTVYKIELYQY